MQEVKEIQELIADGELQQAIDALVDFCQGSKLYEEAIIIKGQYSRMRSDKIKDTVSPREINREQNRISSSVLELANRRANDDDIEQSAVSKVQLIIEGQAAEFGSAKRFQLKRILATILDMSEEEIKILSVTAGSVKVVLELPKEKKILLLDLFNEGSDKLNKLSTNFRLLEVADLETKGKNSASDTGYLKIRKFKGLAWISILLLALLIFLVIEKIGFVDSGNDSNGNSMSTESTEWVDINTNPTWDNVTGLRVRTEGRGFYEIKAIASCKFPRTGHKTTAAIVLINGTTGNQVYNEKCDCSAVNNFTCQINIQKEIDAGKILELRFRAPDETPPYQVLGPNGKSSLTIRKISD